MHIVEQLWLSPIIRLKWSLCLDCSFSICSQILLATLPPPLLLLKTYFFSLDLGHWDTLLTVRHTVYITKRIDIIAH